MFGFRHKIELDKIVGAASKYELKMQCLAATHGNIKDAQELYDFLVCESLPDMPMPKPNVYQQIKSEANGIMQFVRDNKSDIADAVAFIQGLRGAAQPTLSQDIPPLPNK